MFIHASWRASGRPVRRIARVLFLLGGLVAGATRAATAQQGAGNRDSLARRDSAARIATLGTVTVTATRTLTGVFDVPSPVSVVDSAALHARLPNTAVDVFRSLPGLDVTGVGTNQTRPSIRGQRGQRVLLLEDGLRLNNSRRQQDFGELPAVAGVTGIERVEVVRGPSSVLYGTDAIGGVVNIISAGLPSREGVHGWLGYRYGTADDQNTPSGGIEGRNGRLAFRASAAYRETNAYRAPAGRFGQITLDSASLVHDTGVRDRSYHALLGFDVTHGQQLFVRAEQYQAQHAGFGWVDGRDLGLTDQPSIEITYPDQKVGRYSLGYRGTTLGTPVFDGLELTTYLQTNERLLDQNIFVLFGPGTPPGAGVRSASRNFTDLRTAGFRAEATKLIAGRHILTYGADFFRDRSENTDTIATTVVGFGPPQTEVTRTPQLPNATFQSGDLFVQGDIRPTDRVSFILGGRVQNVLARTRETPGITEPVIESKDHTAVGAANVLVRLMDGLNLVGAVGRGFRSPNLVERFFNGPTPEGSAFQQRNPDLEPETNVNVDVGLRVRKGSFYGEGFAFRNDVRHGVRIAATGDSVSQLPVYQNVNVDKLRYTGLELVGGVRVWHVVGLSANYTQVKSRNVAAPNDPIGDTYSSKVGFEATYAPVSQRFSVTYGLRHQGELKDVIEGTNPIGPVLPAFTTHALRGTLRVFDRGGVRNDLQVSYENFTNRLYSEFSNASFFRPEPGRNLQMMWVTSF